MKLPAYTFKQFREYVSAFGKPDGFQLLIIIGSAGLSKTRTMKAACPDARIIEGGMLTPFRFYCELYENRDEPIIIDDIDGIYKKPDAVRLLKSVCQTEKFKTVGWHSASKRLPEDEEGNSINEFTTSSPVCMIANKWETLNADVQAVADRGILLTFQPDAKEIHNAVRPWFPTDKASREIFEFIGENLDIIVDPSMRSYMLAKQIYSAGLDWKSALLHNWDKLISPRQALEKLRAKEVTEREKEKLWSKLTGLSRASYYNWKRRDDNEDVAAP